MKIITIQGVQGLDRWLQTRIIPTSRIEYVEIRKYFRENINKVLFDTNALSLTDHYWIKEKNSDLDYKDINFFENSFSTDLGDIMFGSIIATPNLVTPDLTIEGMLKKRWVTIGNKRALIKGSSSINRCESFNEVIASIVCKHLGLRHVEYKIYESKLDNKNLYSICFNFLQKNDISECKELVPVADILNYFNDYSDGVERYEKIIEYYNTLGIEASRYKLEEMLVLDYIIGNEDRHFRNFGLVRDATTLKFTDIAPIYDNGLSMYRKCLTKNDADNTRLLPFLITPSKQLDLLQNRCRYKNININDIIKEIKLLLNKYDMNYGLGISILEDRLYNIKGL